MNHEDFIKWQSLFLDFEFIYDIIIAIKIIYDRFLYLKIEKFVDIKPLFLSNMVE